VARNNNTLIINKFLTTGEILYINKSNYKIKSSKLDEILSFPKAYEIKTYAKVLFKWSHEKIRVGMKNKKHIRDSSLPAVRSLR